jgi:hypothetical protein
MCDSGDFLSDITHFLRAFTFVTGFSPEIGQFCGRLTPDAALLLPGTPNRNISDDAPYHTLNASQPDSYLPLQGRFGSDSHYKLQCNDLFNE